LDRWGKKGGCEGFIGGAIPIGRFPQEHEIGATDIRKGQTMTAIGYITKNDNGSHKEDFKTVSIRATLIQNGDKVVGDRPILTLAVVGQNH
jgi:hypothetical protein